MWLQGVTDFKNARLAVFPERSVPNRHTRPESNHLLKEVRITYGLPKLPAKLYLGRRSEEYIFNFRPVLNLTW